jgi:tripartite-type tricarboxylate transporter receptor subunit TctC
MLRREFIGLLGGATANIWPAAALAQTYPSRPITMVVPFAAGGTFDVVGRIIATRMAELLGQSVIVENVTGGGGIVGVTRVINAAPDGYTLLFGTVGTHAYNQWIYKKRRYDATNDFTPVTLFSEQPMVLEARKDLPANDLREFIALLKSNGSKMQFGSAGAGTTTHLACALLNSKIGVNVTHVPYRGGGPALNDVIGGQIDYYCANIGGPVQVIKAGQVKALATLSRMRSPVLPDLPTAQEQGLTDFDVVTWNAFFLPQGAPAEVVKRLSDANSEAMDSPAVATRLREMGVSAVARDRRSPQYLARFVLDEIARWAGPIKQNGLQVD